MYTSAVAVSLPVHASWLNQIEIRFSIVQRKVLTPLDVTDKQTFQPDPTPYVQDGVALGAYRPDQVDGALQYLLQTGQPHPDWRQSHKDFICRHLTSDDGRSAERVAELIVEMMTHE